MPCTGLALGLPNISCLDFKLDWDISTSAPTVKVTNNSTVADATKLKWWFFITSPSGVSIYGVDVNSATPPTPDFNQVAWTTKTFNLPSPFTNSPCGQIEFSPNSPYSVVVFVQDITSVISPISNYTKTTILVRPTGNTLNSCGNFGTAAISIKVDCGQKVIMCFDSTKLIYNNILTPATTVRKWTLVYPEDAAGNIPNIESSEANVNFPVSVNSKGYVIYFTETATYDYGANITVKVQYKLYDGSGGLGLSFAVNCNTNLCLLQCQMKKFYEQSKVHCGEAENAALGRKMVNLQWLFSQILSGIFQPLCGIDVGALIEEMQRLMGFDGDCGCGCGEGDNFGFSNPTGGGAVSGGCCPVSVLVHDKNTGIAPSTCPGGYFPASVYDPTNTTIIGVALSADDLVGIINSNAAWMVYGVAFNTGNCTVGFYPAPTITTIPPVIIDATIVPVPPTIMTDTMVTVGTSTPPTGCPATTPFSPALRIYDPTGTFVVGIAYTINDVVSILNGQAGWMAFGTWSVQDNCTVQVNLADAAVIPGKIPVDTLVTSDVCVNGAQFYVLNLNDYCLNGPLPITSADFPLNAVVNFGIGGGNVVLGVVASLSALIAALNATPTKPASVTFSAGYTINNIVVTNTNCTAYSAAPAIILDKGSANFLLYGANHTNMTAVAPTNNGQNGIGLHSMALVGKIPGATANKRKWHTIRIGNYLIDTETNTGKITFYDITNPLFPTIARVITLSNVSGTSFTGAPSTITLESAPTAVPSLFSLYFPTDMNITMSLSAIYVVESTTGTIWKLDFYGTGTGITAAFQDDLMIGKCPRCLVNGILYFSQEGDMEAQIGGRPSGVPIGSIVKLDTGTFSSGGLSQAVISLNEDVWAAAFDGIDTIYFAGERGSIAKYTVSTASNTVYSLLLGGAAQFRYRLNISLFNGLLYWVTQAITGRYCGIILSLSSLGGTPIIADMQFVVSPTLTGGYNFRPLGNCVAVLTVDNFGFGAPGSSVMLYKYTGQFLGNINLSTVNVYNVVPISNVGVYAPTSLT